MEQNEQPLNVETDILTCLQDNVHELSSYLGATLGVIQRDAPSIDDENYEDIKKQIDEFSTNLIKKKIILLNDLIDKLPDDNENNIVEELENLRELEKENISKTIELRENVIQVDEKLNAIQSVLTSLTKSQLNI
eukprot:TRINITY_DN14293_c0_g1_i1.p1 TRINITY_DN14293_c0_g1~~TRINITY_DN14293_c0_g1_i1.p1  ORF type:complete len:135 (-),score=39.70 TRINITY_DN14293_c0_g1_i1:132-536(-)